MASRKSWVVELIRNVTRCDEPTAVMLLERLMEEGLLTLGYGNADIDRVVTAFADTFGTTKISKYDRWASQRLVAKYGAQSVVGILQMLAKHNEEQYAPVVNSVADLESKWVSVVSFLRKHRGSEEINA